MIVKLLTEHQLECLSLKGGCTGLSESTRFKLPHCWKSHPPAQIYLHPYSVLASIRAVYPNKNQVTTRPGD